MGEDSRRSTARPAPENRLTVAWNEYCNQAQLPDYPSGIPKVEKKNCKKEYGTGKTHIRS